MLVQACGFQRRVVVSGPETKAICVKCKAKVRATLELEIADDTSVVMLGRIIEWWEHSNNAY